MAESPGVSLVIPSYRSQHRLGKLLESVYSQSTSAPLEVIRVESGWTDPEPPFPLFSEQILSYRERLGPAAARNRGAARGKGVYLAFVDSDVVLPPNWLEALLRALQSVDTDLVGGAIANQNPETVPSRVLHLIEFSEFLPGLPSSFRASISSSNCLLRRAFFLETGGFNENLLMSEDLEFCNRLTRPPFFVGDTRIEHHHREKWSEVGTHLRSLGFWSGRLRRESRAIPGWWLRRLPPLSFGLLPLRFSRINRRRLQATLPAEYRFLRDQPCLLRGLGHWVQGFRKGVGGGEQGASGEGEGRPNQNCSNI